MGTITTQTVSKFLNRQIKRTIGYLTPSKTP
jgi:hypothetical protein